MRESIDFNMDGWGLSQSSGPGSKRTNIFYSPSRDWEFGMSILEFDYDLGDSRAAYREASDSYFVQSDDVRITKPNIDDEPAHQTTFYARYSMFRYLALHTGLGYRMVEFTALSDASPPESYSSSYDMNAESAVVELGLTTDYDITLKNLISFDWNLVLGVDWFMVEVPVWGKGHGEIFSWRQDPLQTNDIAEDEAYRISYQYPSLRAGVRF